MFQRGNEFLHLKHFPRKCWAFLAKRQVGRTRSISNLWQQSSWHIIVASFLIGFYLRRSGGLLHLYLARDACKLPPALGCGRSRECQGRGQSWWAPTVSWGWWASSRTCDLDGENRWFAIQIAAERLPGLQQLMDERTYWFSWEFVYFVIVSFICTKYSVSILKALSFS